MKSLLVVFMVCAGVVQGLRADGAIGMDEYLDQVRQGNAALKGSQAEDAALGLAAKRSLTAFSPQLAGQVQEQNNQEFPIGATLLSPADTQGLSWDTNLNKLFSTGTQVGLDYSGDKNQFIYSPQAAPFVYNPLFAGFLPELNTYGQNFNISISQPLWRNFMASEVDAGVAKAAADSDEARANNLYQAQAVLFQARQAYVALATARQVGAILEKSLERNREILRWTQRKYNDNLADKVDVLESQAALSQVTLNLSQNREDEVNATIVLNVMRGRTPTAEVGELEPLEAPESLPAPRGERQDLQAAEAALRSSEAQVVSVTQSFTPDVSVFADLGEAQQVPSPTAAMGGYQPNTLVGIKFSANLDYSLYRQVLAGARQAQGYGQAAVEGKRLEIAKDWDQLKTSFAAARERLALARQLEALQKQKADRENTLYLDGRATHFQVLRFEDDYNLARVQTLQVAAEALNLGYQARYYNGDDQPW